MSNAKKFFLYIYHIAHGDNSIIYFATLGMTDLASHSHATPTNIYVLPYQNKHVSCVKEC